MTRATPERQRGITILLGALMSVLVLGFALVTISYGQAEEKPKAYQKPKQTLEAVLHKAYLGNPTIRAARMELRATHEQLPQAMAGWKPSVSADASITSSDLEGSNFGGSGSGGGDGSTAKDVAVSVSQPLYRGGQTVSEMAAARYTIRARTQALKAIEQNILLEAVTAFMDVLRDQALFDLSWNNREVIARQLEATQNRFEVGELTRTDVSQAEARLAKADADAVTARGDLRSVQAVFEQVVGMPAGDLQEPGVMLDLPDHYSEILDLAEQHNPDVLAATYAHKASEEDVDDVFGELLPEISLSGSWNRTLDPTPGLIEEQTAKTIGLSASIPLYQAGAVRSRVRQAKQTANQRYIQILEARRQARQEAIRNWESLDVARAEIRSREAQVRAQKVAQEGVRAETEVGQRTILDALDADQELLDAEAALVSAQRNEVVALFSLATTLGLLTPERLGFAGDGIDMDEHLDEITWKVFDMGVDRVGPAR